MIIIHPATLGMKIKRWQSIEKSAWHGIPIQNIKISNKQKICLTIALEANLLTRLNYETTFLYVTFNLIEH